MLEVRGDLLDMRRDVEEVAGDLLEMRGDLDEITRRAAPLAYVDGQPANQRVGATGI